LSSVSELIAVEVTSGAPFCIEILHPQVQFLPQSEGYFSLRIPPMTLIAFLSYLLKFLSNQALLTALMGAIQKLLH
jgi:hypothetical protein